MHLLHNSEILWGPALASAALSEGTMKAELAQSLSWPSLQEEVKVCESFLEMLFNSIPLKRVPRGQQGEGALPPCSGPKNSES